MGKLGLIAGGGALPVSLIRRCQEIGRPVFVIRLEGFAEAELSAFDGCELGLAQLGRGIAALRAAGCQSVCFAGKVARPDLRRLRPDPRGLAALPGALIAARRGDDGLLAYLLREFEKEGFAVEGAHEVMGALTLKAGPLGRLGAEGHMADVARALDAARAIGRLDIGQAAVACDGLILALEAQEGTDAMLERVAGLPANIRGAPGHPRGVLAKACKPGQEERIDLPAIGPVTVRKAAAAGLSGVAGEAGRLLVLDREAVIALADDLGLFIIGVAPGPE